MSQDNMTMFQETMSLRKEEQAAADRAPAIKKEKEARLDAVRGCIYGGAVGDALGYPVEFDSERAIFSRYGSKGITEYETDRRTGKALISDDTQMTLFTANGLLVGDTREAMSGDRAWPRVYVTKAYLDWLMTQESSMRQVNRHERNTEEGGYSWLLDVPELYSRRAPGNTCLSALPSLSITGRIWNGWIWKAPSWPRLPMDILSDICRPRSWSISSTGSYFPRRERNNP